MKTFAYLLIFTCGLIEYTFSASSSENHSEKVNKLPIGLYYEALCPYCMGFVTTKLRPSMFRSGRLPFTELTLVPYGNAKINGEGNVTCQHGVQECELNAWHGCILEHLNITDALKLIVCMMRGKNNRLETCAGHEDIDVTAVKECKKTRSIEDILKKYGEATSKVSISGVPSITVDNEYIAHDQENLINFFDDSFCAQYRAKFNITLDNCNNIK